MKPKIANVDQAEAWDGSDAELWVEFEDQLNASLARHTSLLRDSTLILRGDRVLDIGCGCGESTRDAARLAHPGSVLGVDLSARMLERARKRARDEGLTNVRFEQADAEVHAFDAAVFDVAISRFGVMFFGQPLTAFRNIAQALRPAGRLAFLCWQSPDKNPLRREVCNALAGGREFQLPAIGAPGPYGLAEPDTIRRVLSESGFADINLASVNEPTCLGKNVEQALRFVSAYPSSLEILSGLGDAERPAALERLRATLAEHDTGAGVLVESGAWFVTARRTR
jgi:ubiquinone/menaquinone biosynthesis C-methylase UbiE